MSRSCNRRGFTLIEILVVLAIMGVMFTAIMEFFRAGNQGIVKASDHAQARLDSIKILDIIGQDLERIITDDSIQNLVIPISLPDSGHGLSFYALHHREYVRATKEMKLVARKVTYARSRVPNQPEGYYVTRCGTKLPGVSPVRDITFETLAVSRACELQVSPFHALTVSIRMRGAWDVNNKALGEEQNLQSRLYHMSHIESQYACMLSIKKAGPPPGVYTGLDLLDDPFNGQCPQLFDAPSIPLDWVRPPGLVRTEDQPYDDRTANIDVEI